MNVRSLVDSHAPQWSDTRELKGGLPAAAFVVLWSTGYIAGKIAIEHAAPFTALTLRFGGAALLFAFARAKSSCGRLLHSERCVPRPAEYLPKEYLELYRQAAVHSRLPLLVLLLFGRRNK